nr:hypothetical protein DA06_07645 [Georgenia sp. SUBG003]
MIPCASARSAASSRSRELAEKPPPMTRVSHPLRSHAASDLVTRTSATASEKPAATSAAGTSSPRSWQASTYRATAVLRPENEKSYG